MNNKKLYNNIISDISKIMKKKLYENNENDEIDINQYVEYQPKYDFNYLNLKKLPDNVIYYLCDKILDSKFTLEQVSNTPKDMCGEFYIMYEYKNDSVLTLLDENEISIMFKADFIFDYEEGDPDPDDYWTEPVPDRYYIKEVDITEAYLTNDKGNFVQITNKDYLDALSNILLNDMDIIESYEDEHMDDYGSAKEYYNDLYGND